MNRWIVAIDQGSHGLSSRVLPETLAQWEQQTGLQLPPDYRSFLLQHDGGRPYPNLFRHTVPDSGDGEAVIDHFLDRCYGWQFLQDWRAQLADRLPERMLVIGADPGLIEIVLSLREQDHGAIYSWVRNPAPWGSADNLYLCPQAASFTEFFVSLGDDEERNGYEYWYMPMKHPSVVRL